MKTEEIENIINKLLKGVDIHDLRKKVNKHDRALDKLDKQTIGNIIDERIGRFELNLPPPTLDEQVIENIINKSPALLNTTSVSKKVNKHDITLAELNGKIDKLDAQITDVKSDLRIIRNDNTQLLAKASGTASSLKLLTNAFLVMISAVVVALIKYVANL